MRSVVCAGMADGLNLLTVPMLGTASNGIDSNAPILTDALV